MRISEFIDALPKAELHLHIEGALSWEMIRARAVVPPSPPWWAPGYRFESFGDFAQVLSRCYERVLTDPSSYHAAARGIFRDQGWHASLSAGALLLRITRTIPQPRGDGRAPSPLRHPPLGAAHRLRRNTLHTR